MCSLLNPDPGNYRNLPTRHIFSVGGERNTWLWVELGRKFSCIHFQKRVKSVLRLADGLAKACPLETILLFNAGAHLGLFSRGCQYTTSLRNGCPHCNHIHINSCLAIQSISNLPTGPIVFGRTEILEAFIFG